MGNTSELSRSGSLGSLAEAVGDVGNVEGVFQEVWEGARLHARLSTPRQLPWPGLLALFTGVFAIEVETTFAMRVIAELEGGKLEDGSFVIDPFEGYALTD